jgi:cell division protein FtsB
MSMGRRPIGEEAMTAPERQQRRRDKLKRTAVRIQQANHALRAELEGLRSAGQFFDLLNDKPEKIAREIVNRVPPAKAGDIAVVLAQYVRSRQPA